MLGSPTNKRERSRSPVKKGLPKKDAEEETIIKQENERKEDKKMENISLGAKNRLKSMSIQMKLGAKRDSMKPKLSVAAAFNQDSDSEPEEMPPEARMRMRNIGR